MVALMLPRELATGTQRRRANVEAMSEDGFTGMLVPYETEVELYPGVREVFTRHSLRAAVKDPARAKVMSEGHGPLVIGMARKLESRESGLWGDFLFDSGDDAQDARRKMVDGFLDELSIEFRRIDGGEEITETKDGGLLVRVNRARLLGVSPVCHGVYGRGATVESVRSISDGARDKAISALSRLTA